MSTPSVTGNPIAAVGSATVPCPSKYDWKLSDVSSPNAGRTEDAKMHKLRIAQKVHLELEWANVGDTDAQTILAAFNPEYISVTYYDYKASGFLTKTFYVGDRQVVSYSRARQLSTITFNIIEQ